MENIYMYTWNTEWIWNIRVLDLIKHLQTYIRIIILLFLIFFSVTEFLHLLEIL